MSARGFFLDGTSIEKAIIDAGAKIAPGTEIGVDLDADRERGFRVTDDGITLASDGATRFDDLGDTVFDCATDLEWEKKLAATDALCTGGTPDVRCVGNDYTWSPGSPGEATGTMYTEFLPRLDGFAGVDGRAHVLDAVGDRVREFLGTGRAGLLHVVTRDRDRVETGHAVGGVADLLARHGAATGSPAESLAERRGDDIDLAHHVVVLVGSPAGLAQHPGSVRVVYHEQGIMLFLEYTEFIQRGNITIHAEDRVGHHQFSSMWIGFS